MRPTGAQRVLIAAMLAGLVGACETPVAPALPPPAPPMLIQIPPPPPPPPSVVLAPKIYELASAYRAVIAAQASIAPTFQSADDVAMAVRTSASYELDQFQQGAIAYAAIAALQEPSFVASMREFGALRSSREQVFARLMANPEYVSQLPNADKAAGLAIAAIDGTGAQVLVAGRAVKQSAYDVQRQAWSRATVPNPAGRLDMTKLLSTQPVLAGAEDVSVLRLATSGEAALSLGGEPVAGPHTPVVTRGLAIAAMAAMGIGGDENVAYLDALLADPVARDCLNMAKLNYYQCLAVSGPHYEDVFCLGQHAMMDTGQCMINAAGDPTPAFVAPPSPPPAPAPTAARR